MAIENGISTRAEHTRRVKRKKNRQKLWMAGLLFLGVLAAGLIALYYFYFAAREKMVLTVAAGPYLSDSYTMMEEIAEVVERNSDILEVNVSATGNSSVNIAELNKQTFDLATIRTSTPVGNEVRLIANLFPDYFQLIANAATGISNFNRLDGKRIAIPPYGTEGNRFFFILLDHFDVDLNSFTWKAVPFSDATRMMFSKEVDAFFTVSSLRDRRLLRFFEDAQLKKFTVDYVPVRQASAISMKRPFLHKGEVPQGAYVGSIPTPRRAVESASVNRILVTRDEVDPAAIRELTRVMFENRLDLTVRFALATAINKPDTSGGLSVPLHEGAQSYYDRNEPSFLQENAEPIALIITICAMIGSALLALRGRFNATQKNRLDSYNYRLLDIADIARKSSCPDELKAQKAELFGVLETVVRALDTDEVTEEGFQSFSLLWESVREIINDRAVELRAK